MCSSNVDSSLLTEYMEIGNNLRERHKTIWYVRSFYSVALTGFATYAATTSLRLPVFNVACFLLFTGLLMVIFDVKYQIAKDRLQRHAIDIADKLGFESQYAVAKGQTKTPYFLQIIIIYILWFAAIISWYSTIVAVN